MILYIYNILFLTYAAYKPGSGSEQPDQGCAAWLAPAQLPVVDPSNDVSDVQVKALEWNMLSREWNLTVSDLTDLHQQSKALLRL
jgi:hypothetical protein